MKRYILFSLVVLGILFSEEIYAVAMTWQIKDLVGKSDVVAIAIVSELDKKNDDRQIFIIHSGGGGGSVRRNPDYDEFMDVKFSVNEFLKVNDKILYPSSLTIPAMKGGGMMSPEPVSFIAGAKYVIFLKYEDPNHCLGSLRLISPTSGAICLEGDKVIRKPALFDGYPPKYERVKFNEPQLLERVCQLIADGQALSEVKGGLINPMVRVKGDRPADTVKIVAGGNSEFAFELYDKLASDKEINQPSGNLFFSPYSISTALALTWAGAKGETSDKFASAMHYKLPQAQQHQAFGKLEKQLNTGGKKGGYQLSVANALWGQKGEPFREEFLELTKKYYGAGLREVDFSSSESAEKARKTINGWVEKKTKDKIKDLIGKGVVDNAILVLTNAIYFKGDWEIQFDKKKTKDAPFNISPEAKVQVPMMYLKDDFKYWADDELQIIELPYKNEHLSMIILLPKKIDGLAELEKKLTLENMNGWLKSLRKQEVAVLLPKFKITWGTIELAPILNEMGLPLSGDFTGISNGGGLFISNILHKAFVAVDEEGTEAAAATAVVFARSAAMGSVFRADRPFVFMIRDNRSESILFMGRVMNPVECE